MRVLKLYGLALHVFGNGIIAAADSSSNNLSSRCTATQFDLRNVLRNVQIISIDAQVQYDYTSFGAGPLPPYEGLNFCQVQVHLTHDTSHSPGNTPDNVLVEVWLPLTSEEWNGRFQATGGAGWATGMFEAQLAPAVKRGWAVVSTNGGYGRYPIHSGDGSWLIKNDSNVDWNLMYNFATRSPVEQIEIGKRITEQYFGKAPHHSYWNGCSTGGRQGYAIAQRFPHLLDGILAEAPAISFTQLVIGLFYPQLRMQAIGHFLTNCELDRYKEKIIEACDHLDGVEDGMLEDPEKCQFDPLQLMDDTTPFTCEGVELSWNEKHSKLFKDFLKGPVSANRSPLFPGFARGVPLFRVANTTKLGNDRRAQSPFSISKSFIQDLILKDPTFPLSSLDEVSYFELFGKASYEYGGILNADNPDLSALQAASTKLLSWHGVDDELIPYRNTLNYREKVENMMGGPGEIDDFYRVFLAPGVAHCGRGIGPVPHDPLAILIDWVENDVTPETLPAELVNADGDLITRDLCLWPAKSKYMGIGDPKRASSWTCEGGTERRSSMEEPEEVIGASRVQEIMGVLADRFKGLGLGIDSE